MKINLVNTSSGFKCATDEDYENKRKLKIGEVYQVDIKKPRNYELHKKFFALINCAWEYQDENMQANFCDSVEMFRNAVTVRAGYYKELIYPDGEILKSPDSISFGKMDEFKFRELYEKSRKVLFDKFLTHISIEEFEKQLINF